jgi:hypothetical protein
MIYLYKIVLMTLIKLAQTLYFKMLSLNIRNLAII